MLGCYLYWPISPTLFLFLVCSWRQYYLYMYYGLHWLYISNSFHKYISNFFALFFQFENQLLRLLPISAGEDNGAVLAPGDTERVPAHRTGLAGRHGRAQTQRNLGRRDGAREDDSNYRPARSPRLRKVSPSLRIFSLSCDKF